MLLSEKGYVIQFNPAMERLSSVLEPPAGLDHYNQVYGALGLDFCTFKAQVESAGHTVSYQYPIAQHDGRRYHEVRLKRLEQEEDQPVYLAQVTDVTRQKRELEVLRQAKEKAESADRLKSNFLSIISHELRTPINGIQGVAQLLQERPDDEESQELGQLVMTSSQRLLQTMESILKLARLESGDMRVQWQEFALPALLQQLFEAFEYEARRKGLEMHQWVHGPEHLVSDPELLEQILEGLLSNAVKYTEHGKITVTAETRPHSWVLRVEDTGPGIEPSFVPQLFEPFAQQSQGLGRQYEGIGLGLHLCRRMALLLGGSIQVSTRPGEGSVFVLWLPQKNSA
jgi:signal transduction histidine kinase